MDVVRIDTSLIEGSRQYYVKSVSTADFMKISSDERIPYWEENDDFEKRSEKIGS